MRRRDTGKLLSPARPAKLFNLLLSCASWELQKGWLTSEALTEGNEQGVQGLGNSTHTGRWVCPALGQDFKTVSHFSYPTSGQGAQTPLTLPPLWSLREHPWCPLGSEPQQSGGARGARRGQHPFAGAEVPLACCLEEEACCHLTLKSMPTVAMKVPDRKAPSLNWIRKQVLPTPESPRSIT